MATLAQTVLVVNKSGKVVNTSKHLVNVFKDAKSAYSERKTELKFAKEVELNQKRVQKDFGLLGVASETRPRTHSKSSPRDDPTRSKPSSSRRSAKPVVERGYRDSFYMDDPVPTRGARGEHSSPLRSGHNVVHEFERSELGRRQSDSEGVSLQTVRRDPRRSPKEADFDDDLAYGDLQPPFPARHMSDEDELRGKVTALNRMLQEVNCLQHSANAIIKNLQSNPDAMAAVALSLAEISNLVAKMAPGALMALKGTAPAAIALLLSPEFLIAVGVGLGVTVVCLGGYKIIKKIKIKRTTGAGNADSQADEIEEVEEVDRVTSWRRGIAGMESQSPGTSVEGEFMTPAASKQLKEAGMIPPNESKSRNNRKSSNSAKKSVKSNKESSNSKDEDGKKTKAKKDKEPSGLRMLFKKDKLQLAPA